MKKFLLSLAVILWCGHAAAQSNPCFSGPLSGCNPGPDAPKLTAEALNEFGESKLDANGGVATDLSVTPAGGAEATLEELLSGAAPMTGVTIMSPPGAGSPTVNTTYANRGSLINGIIASAGGDYISYCPVLSCVTSPSIDHQRTSALFWSTTQDDGHSEEQTVAIETIISTGYAKPYAASTAYSLGDNVRFPGANTVYCAIQGGTTAASGGGPTGTSTFHDGSVIWQWIDDSDIDGKVGLYNEEEVLPGAGNTWGQSTNVELMPGMIPTYNMGHEVDFTNNSGTSCIAGTANCDAINIFMGGGYYSTSAISIGVNSVVGAASGGAGIFGLHLTGALARYSDIEDDATGNPYGRAFGSFIGGAAHTTATIADYSTGPTGILLAGSKTSADITSTATSNASIDLAGTYALAAISTVNATTPQAIIIKDGQKACFNNLDNCVVHSTAPGKFYYQAGGVRLFSVVDSTGAATFKGPVTQNGTP